jgi:biotin carboxyl carrier protein
MRYTAMIDGERVEIDLSVNETNSIQAEIGGRKYTLEAKNIQPGIYWFNWQNRSIEVAVTPNGDGYIVSLGGRRQAVEMHDARTAFRKNPQLGQAGLVEIRAPMPGKVVRVLLPEGSEVQHNQGIIVMEAMKMQNEIKSPKSGVVKKLSVIEGAAVNAGDLLARVE